ncbi:GNAT family N-acetyltransferase [Actinosynnema sp. NPDC047251]|uniref:Acetyltransferase, GNAT family n=1 Tax=Saccharothrix espanaensis (strain ATCC 51144 / DSM 44229 / JCM 9112 / NBRC 15066 / NRRL 15764) TaxID=1179773 RepID=K0JST4_SACES|nr:GNAT family N-acetyltransferase [Saccharothrix espanaensis]CCH30795.1 Acetyltransferase, GNAT family [Saccharothrix espanaensis DSM 44229]
MSSFPVIPGTDLPTDLPTDLTTDRLVLRQWTSDDVDAVVAGTRLPHWAADFPAEGDLVIAGLFAGHPGWLGPHGHRLLVERDSGLVVGSIGLFWPPHEGAVEIGYGVVPSRRGLGFASEATRRLAEFAFTAPEVRVVHATVELANPASARVLAKAGFRHVHTDDVQRTARYEVRP